MLEFLGCNEKNNGASLRTNDHIIGDFFKGKISDR
jgi:hypothetical protein